MLIKFVTITGLKHLHLQIKNLPKGATVIDYSYMIHTEIGNTMVAAKVMFQVLTGRLPFHMSHNRWIMPVFLDRLDIDLPCVTLAL